MQELVKLVLLGVTGVLIAVLFRSTKTEYSIYIGFAAGLAIFFYAIRQIEAILLQFERVRSYLSGAESYLVILLKVIGITYICEFGAGICKDAGYQAVAAQIEVLGKLSVMFAGLPILLAVIDQIHGFL